MNHSTMPPPPPPRMTPRTSPLGLSVFALIGLAALGLPRVILHDLHVVGEGSPLNAVLAIAPVVVWIVVAVVKKVPNPFLTVLVIGAVFGIMLAGTHQLLWDFAFQGNPPSIGVGGSLVPRIAAIPSGIFTGTMVGAIGGLIAWGIQAITRRRDA